MLTYIQSHTVLHMLFMSTLTTSLLSYLFFFFNDTATTEIYTLSLHDALPIYAEFFNTLNREHHGWVHGIVQDVPGFDEGREVLLGHLGRYRGDRKSTRLNSSHQIISYAVFCLKKKNHQ